MRTNGLRSILCLLLAIGMVMAAPAVYAEEAAAEEKPAEAAPAEEPAGPNVDKVLEELATIGPEALVARVKEMQAQVDAKQKEAADLRAKAEAAQAEAEALKQRIATIEGFTKAVNDAMAPPAEEQVAEKPAEEAKAEGG